MAQGACDGVETTGLDYVSSGGFNGTGPDSARQFCERRVAPTGGCASIYKYIYKIYIPRATPPTGARWRRANALEVANVQTRHTSMGHTTDNARARLEASAITISNQHEARAPTCDYPVPGQD